MASLAELRTTPIGPGQVVWIGLRPARRAPMRAVAAATALAGQGLEGDRYAARRGGAGTRQVTLVAAEDLAAIASFLAGAQAAPDLVRRNLVTRGINLLALRDRCFRIGGARLAWSGECHPCSRMEEALGPGGWQAMRGRGGITARVLEGGAIRPGDPIRVEPLAGH